MEIYSSKIKLVDSDEIRNLRHIILRKGKDFSTTSYHRDNGEQTFHLGYFHKEKIISCATFYPEKTNKKNSKNPYRLRGMATEKKHWRKGYGKKIIKEAYSILKSKKCDLLWCNARIIAFPFYKKMGFSEQGDLFDVSDIGPHYYMYKKIK